MKFENNQMKTFGKALIFPLCIAALAVTIYCWKMIHVWPPGKEGRLEEGLYMMAFHGFCLIVILPSLIWSIARHWKEASGIQKVTLLISATLLLAITVVLPEWIIKNSDKKRSNKASTEETIHLPL